MCLLPEKFPTTGRRERAEGTVLISVLPAWGKRASAGNSVCKQRTSFVFLVGKATGSSERLARCQCASSLSLLCWGPQEEGLQSRPFQFFSAQPTYYSLLLLPLLLEPTVCGSESRFTILKTCYCSLIRIKINFSRHFLKQAGRRQFLITNPLSPPQPQNLYCPKKENKWNIILGAER